MVDKIEVRIKKKGEPSANGPVWPDSFRDDGPKFSLKTEDSHPMYVKGPTRTVSFGEPVNQHQKGIKHNNKCRCKDYNNNDKVVMYEHIEQYPAFSCYCRLCMEMLMGTLSGNRKEFNELMKSKIVMLLEIDGIELIGENEKPKVKEFDAMINIGLLTGNQDACKIANMMDDYNLRPNEDDSGIDTLNIEARNRFGWGEGMNYDWKKLRWGCRNCNNVVYSATNPSWNSGEEGTYNWCHCDKCDTYFDKEGMLEGIKARKEFGTSFLDRGVWN